MIAREWKARVPKSKKEGFLEYLNKTGVKETSATPGFKGAQVFVRDIEEQSEVTLITYWENLEVIESFAGKNINRAKLYPEDDEYALDPDNHVSHYEVVVDVWL